MHTCAVVTPANVAPGVSWRSGNAWLLRTTVRSFTGVRSFIGDADAEALAELDGESVGGAADPVRAENVIHVVRVGAKYRVTGLDLGFCRAQRLGSGRIVGWLYD